MKILLVVAARPNFMKAAPIVAAVRAHNSRVVPDAPERVDLLLVHTGQHYDYLMSDTFFSDLGLPEPNVHLGVGSGSHAVQTAEIMRVFEGVLVRERPDILIIVGDVNSTLACALVAAKFPSNGRPVIAHVEAGLRSFDRSMPEEVNRILTDQLSDLLFVTEESGCHNLMREGVPSERIHFVGNTMIDSLLAFRDKADTSTILDTLGLRKHDAAGEQSSDDYVLLTLHRPANVDSRETFADILEGLREVTLKAPVIFPAHPRTQKRIEELGLGHYFSHTSEAPAAIRSIDPLGYVDFLCLMKHARLVITDSGGIQEETTCLGIPCVTVRENTERPVTVENGTNVIAGTASDQIRVAVERQLLRRHGATLPRNWDGKAATRIVDLLVQTYKSSASDRPLAVYAGR